MTTRTLRLQLKMHSHWAYNYNYNYSTLQGLLLQLQLLQLFQLLQLLFAGTSLKLQTPLQPQPQVQLQLQRQQCNFNNINHTTSTTLLHLQLQLQLYCTSLNKIASYTSGRGDHCNHSKNKNHLRSISGFPLPSMHHNNSPILYFSIFEVSATVLCGTTASLFGWSARHEKNEAKSYEVPHSSR